jgi:hypothetical protein
LEPQQARSDLIFLEKPFEMDTFLTLIQQILEENQRKPFFFLPIEGAS